MRDPLWKIKERILVALQTCSITELATETDRTGADLDLASGRHSSTRSSSAVPVRRELRNLGTTRNSELEPDREP